MQWPAGFEPRSCPVFVHNEIAIDAPPERVWSWLVRATRWPEWYPNAPWVRVPVENGPDLRPGTAWRWKTFGVAIRSRVLVFEPARELGWDAHSLANHCYHGWTFEPLDGGARTAVVTEETQNGLLNSLARWYLRWNMPRG